MPSTRTIIVEIEVPTEEAHDLCKQIEHELTHVHSHDDRPHPWIPGSLLNTVVDIRVTLDHTD